MARWGQIPFPSPNEVKIRFVLDNKGKILISLNLCQNILCYTDQRNTHSMQTCPTSKKECFCWHRATLYFLVLLPGFFLLSTEIHAESFCRLLTLFLPVCNRHRNVFLYIHSKSDINHHCTYRIINHLSAFFFLLFTAKFVKFQKMKPEF